MLDTKTHSVPARKNQEDFLVTSFSIANTQGARSLKEETKQKGIRKNASQSIPFQNEKSP